MGMKKSDCLGCYNNDYNHGLGGASQCWSFDEKKELIKRYVIPVDLSPPFPKSLIKNIPPCYTKQKYCCIRVDAINKEGFWK